MAIWHLAHPRIGLALVTSIHVIPIHWTVALRQSIAPCTAVVRVKSWQSVHFAILPKHGIHKFMILREGVDLEARCLPLPILWHEAR